MPDRKEIVNVANEPNVRSSNDEFHSVVDTVQPSKHDGTTPQQNDNSSNGE